MFKMVESVDSDFSLCFSIILCTSRRYSEASCWSLPRNCFANSAHKSVSYDGGGFIWARGNYVV